MPCRHRWHGVDHDRGGDREAADLAEREQGGGFHLD